MIAIIYIRVSSKKQSQMDTTSLETQLEKCTAFATNLGITRTIVFTEVISGANLNRPEFKKAVKKAISLGQNAKFFVYDMTRFSRNMLIGLEALEKMRNVDVVTYSASNGYFYGDDMDQRHMIRLNLSNAENVYDIHCKRVAESLQFRIARGDDMGNPEFGMKAIREENQRRVFVPNDEELAIIASIMELNDDDLDCQQIADHLNNQGIQKRGRPWTQNTVYNLIVRENNRMEEE